MKYENGTPEFIVENNLMKTLDELGYEKRTDLNSLDKVEKNLKYHLERLNKDELNNIELSLDVFNNYVINEIKNNSIFANARKLRDMIKIPKNDNKGYWRLKCYDLNNFENNIFEYSHQIIQDDRFKNRTDVTLFLNGFPIVQIELKKSGVEIFEAFNQVIRYKKESLDKSIFKMLQLFVVSNNTMTKYFSNNKKIDKESCFNWSNHNNEILSNLGEFSESFLNRETLFKLLTDYTVLKIKDEIIMVLRPYQFFAVESILKHINSTNKLNYEIDDLDERAQKLNAYIWHATGSGKTLTSFKVSQLLPKKENVEKVIFLVDRIDLNKQTIDEFKAYLGENSDDLEETKNSETLSNQLKDSTNNHRLIVTTIQKMINVLKNSRYGFANSKNELANKNYVFVIDECHRTQFGEMHKELRKTFLKSRLIGFTGTPIFARNAKNTMTTKEIFGQLLHKYMMINAIKDKNVLKFHVDYIKGPKSKLDVGNDIEVEGIETESFFLSDIYIDKVVDFIYSINKIKTYNKEFKSMLVCENINAAIKYYWKFRKKYPDLKVATVFSKVDNVPVDSLVDYDDVEDIKFPKSEQAKIIEDYNKVYNTNFNEFDFKNYSRHVQSEVANKYGSINLVVVVRMLTTGFNAKFLNTVYLDRSLKKYELIQTISRANRIANAEKKVANIVSFRTFKKDVDYAMKLYNDGDSPEKSFLKRELEDFILEINNEVQSIKNKWGDPKVLLDNGSEIERKDFVIHMRIINKLFNVAKTFIKFDMNMLLIDMDELNRWRDILKEIKNSVELDAKKESILNDIDFQLEIFKTDEINVDYILANLEKLKNSNDLENFEYQISKVIEDIKKHGLKSKAKLLEEFILKWKEKMMSDEENDWKHRHIGEIYQDYRMQNIQNKIENFAEENNLNLEILKEVFSKIGFEKKDLNSYNDMLRKTIDYRLNFIEKENMLDKIKKFYLNIENNDYIENLEDLLY